MERPSRAWRASWLSVMTFVALATGSVVQALDPSRAITQYVHESWTSRDGAPSGTINAITQTPDGYLWLGTESEGLVRFDGVSFVRPDDLDVLFGRRTDRVTSLLTGSDGTLWVGTGYGLARFKEGRWKAFDQGKAGEVKDVFGLFEAPDGAIWYARHWEGLYRVQGDTLAAKPMEGKPRAGTAGPEDALWIVGYDAVQRLSGEERRIYSQRDGLLQQNATAIYADRGGSIWIGCQAGLAQMQGGRVVATYTAADGMSSPDVTAILADRDDNLWVGTSNGGLDRLRGRRFDSLTKVLGLTNNRVTALHEDREGSLWIGTSGGLNRLRDASLLPIGESEGLSHNRPRAIMQAADGTVFVSTSSAGLNLIRDGKIRILRNLPATDFGPSLYAPPEGGMWVGHDDGISYVANGRASYHRLPIQPACLAGDERGVILASSSGKVYRLAGGRLERFRLADGTPLGPEPFGFDYVWMMHQAHDGTLWLATVRGAIAVRDGRARRVWHQGTLSARSISEDEDGTIWLGTMAGLVRVRGNAVVKFTSQQGLLQDDIFHALSDRRGSVWMSCARGVFRVQREALDAVADGKAKTFAIEVFGAADGMRTSEATMDSQPAGCLTRDGRIWFTTTEGVVVIDPTRLRKNELAPPVLVEKITADGETIWPGGRRIPAGAERLDIHYNGLSLLIPQRVRFKYMLEPYDRDWVDGGNQRVAHYMNLDPGSYTFHVQAANNDGVWNEKGAQLEFYRTPRWYQRIVARILFILAVGGLVFGFYRWRVRALRARERDLAQRVDERTADLSREIAEHKVTEGKLATERDLLHSLMDNIPDLIYFKDGESRYTRVNRALAESLGFASAQDVIGKSDGDLFSAELARMAREDERELIENGTPVLGKVEHDARRNRWYLATKVPIRDASRRVVGLVGISKDITERRNAEESFREFVSAVAGGDLTVRGQEGSETLGQIAHLVNQMLEGFVGILAEVRDAAFSVSTSSSEILATSTEIAKGAHYGRDQVHSTTSAVDEMAASMRQIAQSAEESAKAAKQVLEHLIASDRAVDASVKGMHQIDQAVSETAEKMRLLGERSGEIFAIIDLIEEIASRSELLSLNASIEAAHAGEAGRGFAVVAEEIRHLSERSSEAIKQVTDIVRGMEAETRSALTAMEHSTSEVKRGVELSAEAREGLRQISVQVERASLLAGEISLASREQTVASQTVSDAMQVISNITEQSSVAANETTRAVRDLVALSENLTQAISRFTIEQVAAAEPAGAPDLETAAAVRQLTVAMGQLNQTLAALRVDDPGQEGAAGEKGASQTAIRTVNALSDKLGKLMSKLGS